MDGRMCVDSAKTIRLVAISVAAIVIAVGSAMIYSLARQMREQQAPHFATQPQPAPAERSSLSGAASTSPNRGAAEGTSVVEVTTRRLSRGLSQAYVRPPEMTVLHVDAAENRPRMPEIQAPSYAAVRAPHLPPLKAPASDPATAQLVSAARVTPAPWPYNEPVLKPASGATAARAHTVTLWSGTPLRVKLVDSLSSDRAKEGEYFHATLATPIVRDGFVIAEPGSGATGKVIASRHAGMFGRAPDLRLVLVELRTTDNQVVHVQTMPWDDRGRGHNLVSGTVRSAFGAVSGAVSGAARGSGLVAQERTSTDSRNVFLARNSLLEFRLAAPVSLTEHTR